MPTDPREERIENDLRRAREGGPDRAVLLQVSRPDAAPVLDDEFDDGDEDDFRPKKGPKREWE